MTSTWILHSHVCIWLSKFRDGVGGEKKRSQKSCVHFKKFIAYFIYIFLFFFWSFLPSFFWGEGNFNFLFLIYFFILILFYHILFQFVFLFFLNFYKHWDRGRERENIFDLYSTGSEFWNSFFKPIIPKVYVSTSGYQQRG